MKTPIVLSDDFSGILDQLEYTRDNLFITGRAGTGKSTLLQVFRNTTRKRTVVLAPTGIAALNVRGQTIHSFFGFPPRIINKSEIIRRKKFKIYTNIDLIIIDEISMVRADLLDNIDYFLRINRSVNQPFGGVQMVFFGDLFQLPPVVATAFEKEYFRTTYPTPYFFSAFVLQATDLKMLELTHVYRQEEKLFIRLLDSIRLNQMDYDDLMGINERHLPIPEDKSFYITLTSRNDIANRINDNELQAIPEAPHIFQAVISGEFNPQLYPTEIHMVLKKGAQVMFVKNDTQKQFVNGTIGIVSDIIQDEIYVDILDENEHKTTIKLEHQEWEIIRYENDTNNPGQITSKVIGTFKQYPVKLAWAITIHKSQGKTFDKVIINMGGGAFESGQTYVALSRCRTMSGIILTHPIQGRDIIVDERVSDYYEQIKYLS
ncbi:MAG: AAA family ATPase [Saprospiraceae bacterium]|nr:MAG: ATPase AAA [Bacteroidetes bacterium OLB9]MCO6463205.1 AAA family ATPase [Saprospiraceae bacterium]MCZ2338985.1 AAA family ATPase [Chitinophagales bacterium]